MTTLLLTHRASLDHLTPPGHPERPDRIRAVEEVLGEGRFDALVREEAPEGSLARARIDVTLANGDRIVAGDSGLWATVRRGLSTSVAGLLWSLRFIVIGLCFVLPWWIAIWMIAKLWKRGKANRSPAA